jgi:hypothetical protein
MVGSELPRKSHRGLLARSEVGVLRVSQMRDVILCQAGRDRGRKSRFQSNFAVRVVRGRKACQFGELGAK